jgi:hypothetical protein
MKTTKANKKVLVILAAMAAISSTAFGAGVNNTVDPNATLYGAEAYGKDNVIAATGTSAFAVGYNNTVAGDNSFVYGNANKATGTNAIAGGEYSKAAGRNSVAIGSSAQALKNDTFAIGSQARANGDNALAFGNGAYAENSNTVAIGRTVKAEADSAVAIGIRTSASGNSTVAIGRDNSVTSADTTVIGSNNGSVAAEQSVVVGYNNTVVGTDPEQVVVGSNSKTGAQGAVAIGTHAEATAMDAMALGNNTLADNANSVALGTNSVTDAVVNTASATIGGKTYNFAGTDALSTVSVGSDTRSSANGAANYKRTITNVAAGRVSATSTDAINGSQLNATVEAINKNHKDILDTAKGLEMLGDIVSDHETQIAANKQAAADAMAEAKKHTSVTAGDNVVVTTGTNANGGIEYKVEGKKDVSLNTASFGSVSDAVHNTITKDGMGVFDGDVDTQYKASGMTIENRDNLDAATHDINGVTADSNGRHVAFTTDGIDAGSQVINNVKAGVKDTDAVNVKQLNDSVSTESVVADSRVDNIASVGVLNGKSTGDKNAQYGVYVSRTTVDAIAKGSNRFAGDDVIKVERWVAPSNVADLTTFKYDGNKAATKTPLTYKANGVTKTTMLADGLDFTNGSNTTASVDANGVVKYDLNKDITVDSVKAGKVVADKANIAGVTIDNNGINAGGKTITNVARGINANDAATVGQLNDVRTAMANGDAATLNRANAYTDSRVSETTAQNAALAALHPLDFNKHDKFQVATGVGNYKNKTSVALGAFYQPNENTLLSLGATLGAHRNVVNAGATFRFGKHSEMNTDRHDALEAKVKTLEETLANISAKYDELLKKVEETK